MLHLVEKTRKDHECHYCGEIIPKGSRAKYRNAFTGKRDYYHSPDCPKFKRDSDLHRMGNSGGTRELNKHGPVVKSGG